MENLLRNSAAVVIYAVLGIVIYILAFMVVDKITPGHLWNELLEKRNTAIALFMGALGIGISIIIAASIHS
jgi:putative membrane protein